MARLPYVNKDDLSPENRDLLSRNINLIRLFAHSPGAARSFKGLGDYIRHQSTLDPRLRELAILQVGYLARSEYEYSHHVKIGRDFGVTADDVRWLADETHGRPNGLAELDRLVLRAAREITTLPKLPRETFDALSAHFSHEHLVDLIMTIGVYVGVVRILAAFEIDVEDSYLNELVEFPLPAP
jgi:alkylhydroperoxidase family enzyme